MDITTTRTSTPTSDEQLAAILADPGFGTYFTDHMFVVEWTPDLGWHDARVVPYGPVVLDPAAAVLHYAQEIFEGLKAYRHADDSIWSFRPEANAARMARSSVRMALPVLPEQDFVQAVQAVVAADSRWVPTSAPGDERSLYLRPFMFASERFLGVRAAQHVTFMVIASPAGSYFEGGLRPVRIWLTEDYSRAGRGGTGAAKTGGNYASSLVAQAQAYEHGCDQVVFLDASQGRYVEELGGMNLCFVHADGHIVTPATDTILEGITRASIIEIAGEMGHKVEERPFSLDEWREGVASGEITEVFACGTAAVVTPVGELVWDGGSLPSAPAGEVWSKIRGRLVDIQFGRAADDHGWMRQLA